MYDVGRVGVMTDELHGKRKSRLAQFFHADSVGIFIEHRRLSVIGVLARCVLRHRYYVRRTRLFPESREIAPIPPHTA